MDPRIELTALPAEVGVGNELRSRAAGRLYRYDSKRVDNSSGYIVDTLSQRR
ncbi:MAG: hypothetical protein P8Y27_14175 [Chromatiaceae bacterium]